MKKLMFWTLLLPLVAMASINPEFLKARIVRHRGNETGLRCAAPVTQNPGNALPATLSGRSDTVGGSDFDYQVNGPSAQAINCDQGYGIHASWIYSQGDPTVDRNLRYNFRDASTGSWAFNQGTDYMLYGVNWFGHRSGFGNLAVGPSSHVAYISAHFTGPSDLDPTVARDASPGNGSPDECQGTPTADGYVWPYIGLTNTEKVQVACMDNATGTQLYYTRIDPWCTWMVPVRADSPSAYAGFPDYNIAASSRSGNVALIWDVYPGNSTTAPLVGYYKLSTDDGLTWSDTVSLGPPQVFTPGTDTLPSFDVSSLSGFFDSGDNLHIVGQIVPFITGTGLVVLPAVVCHWSAATGWTVIHRAQSDTLAGLVADNSSYAARPSITEIMPGRLVCVWEQFDSLNVDDSTGYLRGDIAAAVSGDGGTNWGLIGKVATGGSTSLRFPSCASFGLDDTCHIIYLQDLQAGDGEGGEGAMTSNPVIHQAFEPLVSIAEPASRPSPRITLGDAIPTVFRNFTKIAYDLPSAGAVSLVIHDVTGRPVRALVRGQIDAGHHMATWDGRYENGAPATPGVYFCALTVGYSQLTRKLALLR